MVDRAMTAKAMLLAAVLACAGCSRNESDGRSEARRAARNAVRTAATSAGEHTSGSPAPLDALIRRCVAEKPDARAQCRASLQQLAKQAALLEVGGIRHEATHVYFCEELSRHDRERDPWRCSSELTPVDDTLYTTAHQHRLVALGAGERARLVGPLGHPPAGLIKVGAGGALELDADGYVAARRLTVDRGATLSAAEIPVGRTVLLFALFRHDERWVRKHVWVVRQPSVDAGP